MVQSFGAFLTLILRQGYTNVPDARRRCAALPLDALKLCSCSSNLKPTPQWL